MAPVSRLSTPVDDCPSKSISTTLTVPTTLIPYVAYLIVSDIVFLTGGFVKNAVTKAGVSIHSRFAGHSIVYDVLAFIVIGFIKFTLFVASNGTDTTFETKPFELVVAYNASASFDAASISGCLTTNDIAPTSDAPAIDVAFDFEQFDAAFDDFLNVIEEKAMLQAKTTIDNMVLHNSLTHTTDAVQAIYLAADEELNVEMAQSIHSAAFDDVDVPEEKKGIKYTYPDGESESAEIVDETVDDDTSCGESLEDIGSFHFQDADKVQNEQMSMIDFHRDDMYLFAAAASAFFSNLGGSEDQVFNIPTEVSEAVNDAKNQTNGILKEALNEYNESYRETDHARDNFCSADNIFTTSAKSNNESDEDEIPLSPIIQDRSINYDPLDREDPGDDSKLIPQGKFKLRLFTIMEESEEEKEAIRTLLKSFGNAKTFVPIDEMACQGLLFSDDEPEGNNTLKSLDISIESSNFEDYKSVNVDLRNLSKSPSTVTPETNPEAEIQPAPIPTAEVERKKAPESVSHTEAAPEVDIQSAPAAISTTPQVKHKNAPEPVLVSHLETETAPEAKNEESPDPLQAPQPSVDVLMRVSLPLRKKSTNAKKEDSTSNLHFIFSCPALAIVTTAFAVTAQANDTYIEVFNHGNIEITTTNNILIDQVDNYNIAVIVATPEDIAHGEGNVDSVDPNFDHDLYNGFLNSDAFLESEFIFDSTILDIEIDNTEYPIVDYGYVGPLNTIFELPTVSNRVIEEVVETEPEAFLADSVAAAVDPIITAACQNIPKLLEHFPTSTAEAKPPIAEDMAETTGFVLEAISLIDVSAETLLLSPEGPIISTESEEDSLGAIDDAFLLFPSDDNLPESADVQAIMTAMDRVIQTLLEPGTAIEPGFLQSSYEEDSAKATASSDTTSTIDVDDQLYKAQEAAETSDAALLMPPAIGERVFQEPSFCGEYLDDISLPEISMTRHESMQEAWDIFSTHSDTSLAAYNEEWRLHDRALGLQLPKCTWGLLDKPNVFGTSKGPLLMVTTPGGDIKYPQDMKVYPGAVDWADLEDSDDEF
ncbi:hypothetical protein SEUCBS140593_009044 [Sporothrix eucalyptigena]|uniref:Uncharacterized protein n=1 Tax=Sporothrix eucalyptigena TaxID=1812306 RepID=A0ABP0CRG3_9PEZI